MISKVENSPTGPTHSIQPRLNKQATAMPVGRSVNRNRVRFHNDLNQRQCLFSCCCGFSGLCFRTSTAKQTQTHTGYRLPGSHFRPIRASVDSRPHDAITFIILTLAVTLSPYWHTNTVNTSVHCSYRKGCITVKPPFEADILPPLVLG